MTRLFRSKSCTLGHVSLPVYGKEDEEEEEDEDEEEEEEGYLEDENPAVRTPFISPDRRRKESQSKGNGNGHVSPILAVLAAALRKSLVTCSVERDDVANMDIGWPTDVRHVSHVTFDRFNGFLGVPVELQTEVPRKVPSASASVFGVSAQSMQCSYDNRGNSVPTILLRMQNRLYSEGGLQAEGIFRINAENSQEENVRNQLNKGVVPRGIDVHCLAGLIKAWFRELPRGVLDSLTPEQVMHCNTEEECTQLLRLLSPTEAALLDWAINLMADVVQHEQKNKMNARNIAMVFAPNMTQMADPLTALIHAVQVMNFLKTLILKTLRERGESAITGRSLLSCAESPCNQKDEQMPTSNGTLSREQTTFGCHIQERPAACNFLRSATLDRLESDTAEKFKSKSDAGEEYKSFSKTSPIARKRRTLESSFRDEYEDEVVEGILDRLGLKKGMRKLCRHPVFQLSKPIKKSGVLGM